MLHIFVTPAHVGVMLHIFVTPAHVGVMLHIFVTPAHVGVMFHIFVTPAQESSSHNLKINFPSSWPQADSSCYIIL
jgi:hypothetical protein